VERGRGRLQWGGEGSASKGKGRGDQVWGKGGAATRVFLWENRNDALDDF
jgi:hypothetical protein